MACLLKPVRPAEPTASCAASAAPSASATGQRYIHHAAPGSTVHLFIREVKVNEGALGVPAYLHAGPMTYREHTGDRPMRIMWELAKALPADMYAAAPSPRERPD